MVRIETSPSAYNKLFINGQYVDALSHETLKLRNPKDNSIVTDQVPVAGAEDVNAAVAHAEAAFEGLWSKFSALERTTCFLKLAELLEERLTDILMLDSLTTGNPISLIPTREKSYIRSCLLYYGMWHLGSQRSYI